MTSLYDPPTTVRRDTPSEAQSESVIDRHSHFNGHYKTARDLRIEGAVEGDIECEGTVTVAPDAKLDAKVQARNVIIAGAASGTIECHERFTLRPTGEMRGQVRAASLVIEEGAFFDGEFQMGPPKAQPGQKPNGKAAQPPPPEPAKPVAAKEEAAPPPPPDKDKKEPPPPPEQKQAAPPAPGAAKGSPKGS